MKLLKKATAALAIVAVFLTISFSLALAIEPEELTSATVLDRDGRVITVGIEPGTNTWSALADGQAFTIYTGLAPNQYGMWYCVAGRVKFDYTGFVEFQGDQWYVEKGKVVTDFSGQKNDNQYVYTIDRGKLISRNYTEDYSRKLDEAEAKKKSDARNGALVFAAMILAAVLWIRHKRKKQELQKEKERKRKREKAEEVYEEDVKGAGLAYVKTDILTPREKRFYPYLKEVADELGLTVSLKPRLGDLVSGAHHQYSSEGAKELFKVQRKHVDFALFDPDTLETKLIIELDDTTHERQDRVNRDVFVDNVLENTGYKILHVYSANNLKEEILKKLNEEQEESE